MSELLDVLNAQENDIALTFLENLDQSHCPTLMQTPSGSCRSILEAVRACCRNGDDTPGRQWAAALRREASALGPGVAMGEVLSGLNCFERAAAFHIVKAVNQKMVLVSALAQLSATVDSLRRCYADAPKLGPEEDAAQPLDFAALAEAIDAFVCLATLHGRPFYVNPAGCRLVGREDDGSLLPLNLHDFYTQESWAELRDVAVPAVKQTGTWHGRSRLRNRLTGEVHDVVTNMLLVKHPEGERPHFLAIVHDDARDLIRLEKSLNEVLARKSAILESSLDPIITIDRRGVITEFNRAAEQIFGHPRQKVLGTKPSEVLFPASKSAGHQNRIDRYLDAGEG